MITRLDLEPIARGLGVSEERVRQQAAMIAHDRVVVRDGIKRGMGVGVIPDFLIRNGLRQVLPGFSLPRGPVSALTLPALRGDVRVAAFVDAMRELLREGASGP
ncbi:MAG: hypothetical protein AAFX99_36840 [Myxococcota bacterium]